MDLGDTIKINSLKWVKQDLKLLLVDMQKHFEIYLDSDQSESLHEVMVLAKQVAGILTMVQVNSGLTLCNELLVVLQQLSEGLLKRNDEVDESVLRGIIQLGDYLDIIVSTQNDQIAIILPVLNDLRTLRGVELYTDSVESVPAVDSFEPSIREQASDAPVEDIQKLAKKIRIQFQIGLLAWLKGTESQAGVRKMQSVVEQLRHTAQQDASSRLWWGADGLLQCISQNGLDITATIKSLVGKLDRQIKLLADIGELEFSAQIPSELVKNILYYISHSHAQGELIEDVKRQFRRASSEEIVLHAPNDELLQTVAAAIKEDINQAKDILDIHGALNDVEAMAQLPNLLTKIGDTMSMLGLVSTRERIVEAARDFETALEAIEFNPESMPAVADVLLMAENVLSIYKDTRSIHKAENYEATQLENNQQQLIGSVVSESQKDMAKAREAILEYLQDVENKQKLSTLPAIIDKVAGAMFVAELEPARSVLTGLAEYISNGLLQAKQIPNADEQDTIADLITGIEYFLDAVAENKGNQDMYLQVAEVALVNLRQQMAKNNVAAEVDDADFDAVADAAELIGSSELPADELIGSEAEPIDASLQLDLTDVSPADEAVEISLIAAHKPATPAVDAAELAPAASTQVELQAEPAQDLEPELATAQVLATAAETAEAAEQAAATAAEAAGQAAEPEPETEPEVELAAPEVSTRPAFVEPFTRDLNIIAEDVDEEILEIFIEECLEEHERISELFPIWKQNLADEETITTIRRSFHTLKGSGRLVGAQIIGEFGWAMESMMNRVIDGTIACSPDVVNLVEDTIGLLPQMIEQLTGNKEPIEAVYDHMARAWCVTEGRKASEADASSSLAALDSAANEVVADEVVADEAASPAVEDAAAAAEVVLAADAGLELEDSAELIASPAAALADVSPELAAENVEITTEIPAISSEFADSAEFLADSAENTTENRSRSLLTAAELSAELPVVEPEAGSDEPELATLDAGELDIELASANFSPEASTETIELAQLAEADDDEIIASPVEDNLQLDASAAEPVAVIDIRRSGVASDDGALVNLFADDLPELPISSGEVIGSGETSPVYYDSIDIDTEALAAEIAPEILDAGDDSIELNAPALTEVASVDEVPEVREIAAADDIAEVVDIAAVPELAEVATTAEAPPADCAAALALPADMDPVLAEIYSAESGEHIDTIEAQLAELNAAPLYNNEELVRALHTIHGSSRTAGVDPVADVARRLEYYGNDCAELGEPWQPEAVTLLGKACEDFRAALRFLAEPSAAAPDLVGLLAQIEPLASAATARVANKEHQPSIADASVAIDNNDELVQMFLEEGIELVDECDASLQRAEEHGFSDDLIEELQRQMHTLKGGARMAEMTLMGDLAHAIEELVIEVKSKRISANDGVKQGLRAGCDQLASMINEVQTQGSLTSCNQLLAHLDALRDPDFVASGAPSTTVAEPPSAAPPVAPPVETSAPKTADLAELAAIGEQRVGVKGDDELVEIFIDEAEGIVHNCDNLVYSIEPLWLANDCGAEFNSACDALKRELHTLKGGAYMANVGSVGELANALETAVNSIAANKIAARSAAASAVKAAVDKLAEMITEIKEQAQLTSANALIAILNRVSNDEFADSDPAAKLLAQPSEQSRERAEQSYIQEQQSISQHADTAAAPKAMTTGVSEQVRVSAERLEHLVNNAGEVSIFQSRASQKLTNFSFNLQELEQTINRMHEQVRQISIETDAQIDSRIEREAHAQTDENFDPLEMDRYSNMQQLTRSLLETVNDLEELKNTFENLVRDSETIMQQQQRVSTDLQEGLMGTRMINFEGLTSRLRRLVRQTCATLNKQASISFAGMEQEVDRSIQEHMVSPLEHMIRNALAHGIEAPEAREFAGKPAEGNIALSIERDGSYIVINLQDDGAGIDVDALRQKALERGIIDPAQMPDDRAIMQLILHSGFSTAKEVSQVSGRGVGMDVVNNEIKALGGALHINSVQGAGTTFSIRLPLTLAINQALMVTAGEQIYAVQLNAIESVARVLGSALQEQYLRDTPLFKYGDELYSIYHLAQLLGQPTQLDLQDSGQYSLLLVRIGERRLAVHIDTIVGRREIVVKPIGRQLSTVAGIAGATILDDGEVAFILEFAGLINRLDRQLDNIEVPVVQTISTEDHDKTVVLDESKPKERGSTRDSNIIRTVMVVDDSITIRKVSTRFLERNNFKVVTAKDGMDAIAQLQEVVPDIMLLDIEMPRMDGFGVAEHVRNSVSLRDLPIIMITSRTGDKHRERAMGIGVNRYLGKPFQEDQLLAEINDLLEDDA